MTVAVNEIQSVVEMPDKKEDVVVASYLLVGLKEEDIMNVRKFLVFHAQAFKKYAPDGTDYFYIALVDDLHYPCLALYVKGECWVNFVDNHDIVETALLLNQDGILSGVH